MKRLRASFSFFVFHSSELADIIQKKIKMYSGSLVCQDLCIVKFFTVLFCCYSFLKVKQIEKRDSVLTSKQQIDRLLRPGASYFNLNPFEVT